MKLKWLGHASFLITSDKGTRIITDPYTPGGLLTYTPIKEAAEVVTVSHEHGDHNNSASVTGKPQVIKGAGRHQVKDIEFRGVPSHHDTSGGSQRGQNTIFCFMVDGIRVCHLGDLGHPLTKQQLTEIGPVDVLLIPVGGTYTIEATAATEVVAQIKPKVVIPMHFKTAKCGYPIVEVEGFLKGRANVKRPNATEVEFQAEQLPATTETIVLQHAL